MKSFNDIRAEALDYNIRVELREDKVEFRENGKIVAWRYKIPCGWQGFTERPGSTSTFTGRKGAVANWCLDWAANGF